MADKNLDRETIETLIGEGISPEAVAALPRSKNMPSNTAGLPGLRMYKDPSLAGSTTGAYMLGGKNQGDDEIKNRGMAQAMFVSPDYADNTVPIAHEAEHLLARQNLGHPSKINNKFDELMGDKGSSRIDVVRAAIAAAPYLKEKYGLDSGYFSEAMYKLQGSRAKNLLYEQLADLAALEQKHGVDLTKDPELRKTLFKSQDVRETYNALTGLRQTRLDPRDLPPHTRVPEPGMVDTIKKKLGFSFGGAVPHAGNNKLI